MLYLSKSLSPLGVRQNDHHPTHIPMWHYPWLKYYRGRLRQYDIIRLKGITIPFLICYVIHSGNPATCLIFLLKNVLRQSLISWIPSRNTKSYHKQTPNPVISNRRDLWKENCRLQWYDIILPDFISDIFTSLAGRNLKNILFIESCNKIKAL